MFGHKSGFDMNLCERVRWYLFSLGAETDVHGAYFDGNTVNLERRHVDTIGLLPATFQTVDMIPDQEGSLQLKCNSFAHAYLGMSATYNVTFASGMFVQPSFTGYTSRHRIYFIAGELQSFIVIYLSKMSSKLIDLSALINQWFFH
jgi:hypothetical protein